MLTNEKSAAGLKGYLLNLHDKTNNTWVFRIYNEDKSYKDYTIFHDDLKVELIGNYASIYEEPNGEGRAGIIDYPSRIARPNIPILKQDNNDSTENV